MKEKLYTIPVNDAFSKDCECPVCVMYRELETAAIDYTMGPSYMEDDIRAMTDESGFCEKHIRQMYANQNRLGLTLMLTTHMAKVIKDVETLQKGKKPASNGLFRKKDSASGGLGAYVSHLSESCFVCSRIEQTFERYLATVLFLYKTESDFRETFRQSKGFCTTHYGMLYDMAPSQLSGSVLNEFLEDLNHLYLDNMKRVLDDLEWFRDKFDYRNADAPWKNSQDALPRSMLKTNGILPEEG